MSFENIDYQEILDCNEWTESRLYELFSNRFIESDRNFHVRPKAAVAADLTVNPNGGMTKKYCYWFNAKYVKKIIENEL